MKLFEIGIEHTKTNQYRTFIQIVFRAGGQYVVQLWGSNKIVEVKQELRQAIYSAMILWVDYDLQEKDTRYVLKYNGDYADPIREGMAGYAMRHAAGSREIRKEQIKHKEEVTEK